MKLIDKAAVVAEIERRIILLENNSDGIISMLASGMFVNEYKDLLSFLDTLEVKEVDLEKEKDDYWNKLCDSEFGELLERDAKWFDDIAEHFFELGLKTKGE
ncbi:MAG: hypothetical protein J6S67_00205 [Methanobrevibacter sp.]|nr:hypothetical protein [Methanobrevibacter sp.]